MAGNKAHRLAAWCFRAPRHLPSGVALVLALLGIARLVLPLPTLAAQPATAAPLAFGVTTYHADAARSGHYEAPGLTWAAAAQLVPDTEFDGRVPGHIYAQPLLWQPPGGGAALLIVATEDDVVTALDAATGLAVWQTSLGTPVPLAALPCGNIDPLGITGTPVIDPASGTLVLDAMTVGPEGPRHQVFGLRISDGATLPGWPLDVGGALAARGIRFNARDQNQRAALALLNGIVYLGFGGHAGDCGEYHGMMLGVALGPPSLAEAWVARGDKGGIWSPGGASVADGHLYFATGNAERRPVGADHWDDGNGVFRYTLAPAQRDVPRNFFAPANYASLDDADLDLGGTVPVPIDLPDGALRLLAMGKDGNAYLLDRQRLGGIGGALAVRHLANSPIIQAPVLYRNGGQVLTAYRAPDTICPDGRSTTALVALAVSDDALRPVWCAPIYGRGIPIVSTSTAEADPIVWVAGADGDERLHGFRGDTGQPVFASAPLPGLRHFVTPIIAAGRIYLAGDGRVFAFRWSVPVDPPARIDPPAR